MSIPLIEQSLITEKKPIKESDLIMGILWEGDLELHTNKERMINNPFGERIIHGDSITAILFGLLFSTNPLTKYKWYIDKYQCSYRRPVYINDIIFGKFSNVNQDRERGVLEFEFEGFKQNDELVSSGKLSISLEEEER